MVPREACPQCGSTWYKRSGHIHTGKQNHRCKLWGRAFVLNPEHPVITEEQRSLIERLLLERAKQKERRREGTESSIDRRNMPAGKRRTAG
jgi:transposase-like protein